MNNPIDLIMESVSSYFQSSAVLSSVLMESLRYLLPALAFLILLRCARSMLTQQRQPELWAWLTVNGEVSVPITHWENMLGRNPRSDIVLNDKTVSRSHAVLTRYDDGSWSISDIGSRGGIRVNGNKTSFQAINYGDTVTLGALNCRLEPVTEEEAREQKENRIPPNRRVRPLATLILLSAFQFFTMLKLYAGVKAEDLSHVTLGFLSLIAISWLLFLIARISRRSGFEPEILALFLCTMGMAILASAAPQSIEKELLAILAGLAIFLFLGLSLRSLERAKKIRYLVAAAGIGLLLVNLIFGQVYNGAKNWIQLGSFSFQPSELVKVCFVFVGASTLERVVARRNLIAFIAYSGAVCLCLAFMSDFGAALIFFIAFLVIAFMRSGSFAGLALASAATVYAAALVLKFKPYVLSRFSAWGHVWDFATEPGGYQQTRAMMCIASGGLFGLGGGKGFMKYVAASDTDLVFSLISEEWGLVLALLTVLALLILAAFALRSLLMGRSCFYSIGAISAVTIMLVQAILNVFGTVDLLPLTGVTFPFVSNGGSSMMASWGLLAFIKAADTRANASFAIRLRERGRTE